MQVLIDFFRYKRLLWLEKYRDTSSKYNEESGEREPVNDIQPIISSYLERTNKKKPSVPHIINGQKFSKLEAIIIHSFTSDGSLYINHALATPKPKLSAHKKLIIKIFDTVLRKINRTDKDYIYRMDVYSRGLEKAALSFFKNNVDKILNIPWFLSSTEYSNPWDTKIVWQIKINDKTKTKARLFYPLVNNHGDEKEIRFERDTKVKIIKVEKKKDEDNVDYHIVHMIESYDEKFDINLNYTLYWN